MSDDLITRARFAAQHVSNGDLLTELADEVEQKTQTAEFWMRDYDAAWRRVKTLKVEEARLLARIDQLEDAIRCVVDTHRVAALHRRRDVSTDDDIKYAEERAAAALREAGQLVANTYSATESDAS